MTLTAVINPVVPLNLIFPHQRVICPQSRQSAKYRIVTHNFTNDNLTNGNSPSYQKHCHLPPPYNYRVKVETNTSGNGFRLEGLNKHYWPKTMWVLWLVEIFKKYALDGSPPKINLINSPIYFIKRPIEEAPGVSEEEKINPKW